jgi:hypothetical protein
VDATLKEFLDLFYGYNTNFINKYIIYESFKNENGFLSSSINLNDYKNMLNFKLEFNDLINKGLKYKHLDDLLKKTLELDSSNKLDVMNKFLIYDYIFTFTRLAEH